MSKRSRVAGAAVITVLVAAAVLAGSRTVASPSPLPDGLPEEYLGRWLFVGSSGGMNGGGDGSQPGGSIVITADNTIERYAVDGSRTGTERISPIRGRSIFSTGDEWILDAGSPVPKVIRVGPDGTLTISDNVYDGYSSHYVRPERSPSP